MDEKKPKRLKQVGRKPKPDPCKNRYVIRLNDEDNARFLALYDRSGLKNKARFITSCLFGRELKVVKIDKAEMDFYMRLTTFHSQYRSIGVNYNQITKAVKTNFGEQRGLALLYKLEKLTVELIVISKQVILLTDEFERWLRK